MYQVCPVLPAFDSELFVPYSPLPIEPSMVGVAHCAHAGAAITKLIRTTNATFDRRARRMEILAISLALDGPVVEQDGRLSRQRLKGETTLVPMCDAMIELGKRHKMYTKLGLCAVKSRSPSQFRPPRSAVDSSAKPQSAPGPSTAKLFVPAMTSRLPSG